MSNETVPQSSDTPIIPFAIASAILASILFSGKGILAKAAMSHGSSAMGILALRMGFAAPIYATVLFWALRRQKVPGKLLGKSAVLGLLGCYLAPTLNFYGLGTVSASLERVLIHACPALILVLAWAYGRQKITRLVALALAISYLGVAISCLGRDGGNTSANPTGVIAILTGCIIYAFFVVHCVEIQKQVGTLIFTSTAMLASALACLVQTLFSGTLTATLHPPSGVIPIALVLAVFCTAAPAYLSSYGMMILGAGRSASFSMIGPLLTPLAATAILGERMSVPQIGGFALVFTGGLLLSRRG
jgi:drug/metabolite transporter (DMT)-like permease